MEICSFCEEIIIFNKTTAMWEAEYLTSYCTASSHGRHVSKFHKPEPGQVAPVPPPAWAGPSHWGGCYNREETPTIL